MQYGDFIGIVQLGVGLHLGTALLNFYGEFSIKPIARVLNRTRSLFGGQVQPPQGIGDELEILESRFQLFEIRFHQEYRWYAYGNLPVSVLLAIILIVLTFKAGDPITDDWVWCLIIIT